MKKRGLKEFESKIKNLKDYIALATVPAKSYTKNNIEMIKILTNVQNTPGVYVTLNKPFEVLEGDFKKAKVETTKIIFIDAVSQTAGGETKKTKNCLFIGSPDNLSDISIAMDQAVRAVPGSDKFVFFDSLSTLLMFNSVDIVAKFVHFLANKMRVWKVKGIIISLEEKEKNKELIDKLSQVCDIVLNLGRE